MPYPVVRGLRPVGPTAMDAAARSVRSRSPIASHAASITPGNDRLANSQSTHRQPTVETSCPDWIVSKKRAGHGWA